MPIYSISDLHCQEDDFYPDKQDCTVFYECHNGQATQLHCASGLGYRSDIRTCDLIQYVKECRKYETMEKETEEIHITDNEKEVEKEVYSISEDGDVHNFIPLSVLDQAQDDQTEGIQNGSGENT